MMYEVANARDIDAFQAMVPLGRPSLSMNI